MQRSFKAEVYSCPVCRADLGEKYDMDVNEPLQSALLHFLPGYDNGR